MRPGHNKKVVISIALIEIIVITVLVNLSVYLLTDDYSMPHVMLVLFIFWSICAVISLFGNCLEVYLRSRRMIHEDTVPVNYMAFQVPPNNIDKKMR